jgi:hypothetical protein
MEFSTLASEITAQGNFAPIVSAEVSRQVQDVQLAAGIQ